MALAALPPRRVPRARDPRQIHPASSFPPLPLAASSFPFSQPAPKRAGSTFSPCVYVNQPSSATDAIPSTGFWVTFVAFLLLCFAGCTVCFGRRRDRLDGATTYPYSWRDRFRIGGRKTAV